MSSTKHKSRNFYIAVYSIVVWSVLLVSLIRSFLFYSVCIRCSQRLHDFMFGSLIRASMCFFEKNPSGRILNRFSKDINVIDETLPKAIMESSQNILAFVGAFIIIIIVNPILFAPVVFIVLIFYWIRKAYLKTSKNLQRLEGRSQYYYAQSTKPC